MAPPSPRSPPVLVEDTVSRYPTAGEEPQVSLTQPEGRPQGIRRRRPKMRRRPQNVLPKEVDESEKPVRGEENTSILDLVNEDKKRTDLFPNSPASRSNPSTYVSDPAKAALESDSPAEPVNAAGPQYYRPQPPTNRLPVGDSEPVGNSRGYLDAAAEGPASYVPERPNDASYVPILNPIRVPSEGATRLPAENIRDTNVKPVLNVIPESDVPLRSHSEVRLPENEQPDLAEYAPHSFDSNEDTLAVNPEDPAANKEPLNPTNRRPNPSEIHYNSAYPEYADYSRGPQTHARRRQEPPESSVHNPPVSTYSSPRRDSGTKPQEYDNDAEVDRRQTSLYRPPLERVGSRYKTENLEEPTRSRSQEHSPSTGAPRTRGSSRYQSPESEYAPERTRSSTNTRSETPSDSTSRSRSPASSQSSTRARGSQRYTPEAVEVPRISTRNQIQNTRDVTRAAGETAKSSTGYDDLVKDTEPSSNVRSASELRDYGSVRNTLRSGPQYEVRDEEPVNSYEESVEEADAYNPYLTNRQANTRGRTNQGQAAPVQPPEPEYHVPPNRQQSRSQYEPQNPRSRHQPQYAAPQNPRTDSRQAASRQNPPSSRQQGRTRQQNPEPAPSPRRPSGGSNFKCPDAYGFFADPVQCDKYYECRNGTAEVNLCHDGLAFNAINAPTFLRCDSLRDVDCKSRPELRKYN